MEELREPLVGDVIRVRLRTTTGSIKFPVTAPVSTSIEAFKGLAAASAVGQAVGWTAERIELSHYGEPLKEGRTLSSYGIKDGDEIMVGGVTSSGDGSGRLSYSAALQKGDAIAKEMKDDDGRPVTIRLSSSGQSDAKRKSGLSRKRSSFLNPARPSGTTGASVLSSVITLSSTQMGVGVLALPHAFAQSGLFGGLSLLASGAVLAALSIFLLNAAGARCGLETPTLFSLCNSLLPGSGVVLTCALTIQMTGGVLMRLVVAADNITLTYGAVDRTIFLLAAALYFVPVCFLRSLDSLRIFSSISIICLLVIALTELTYLVSPELLGDPNASAPTAPPAAPDPLHDWLGRIWELLGLSLPAFCGDAMVRILGTPLELLRTAPTFVIAFFCQHNVFTVLTELDRPTSCRKVTVVCLAMLLTLTTYTIFAASGYITFGGEVASNVLNSYPPDAPAVAVTRTALAVALLGSVPLLVNPARLALVSMLELCVPRGKRRGPQISVAGTKAPPPSVFVTAPLDIAVILMFDAMMVALALNFSDLGQIVSLSGATTGASLFFIVPAAAYLLSSKRVVDCVSIPALLSLVMIAIGATVIYLHFS
ncbi:hypothetical protein EMIHUDRAFT_196172 [Emiliania huxleyi CCMP1516]|uniref:Ubiquitin-like domain-containing protein n=2 Tax=Emiliania huxleyi TaxID=2903 RepID=A0A0D3J3L7_EMIH1|nr:hypothetical protein EMIHUDRAFT_196172 [Emiliania huxleyi CCMP1516]EOD18102.1 hypothetical protein EMIHUDRAFT_196172 [Emiliania huxleyi CCMP1516]|eukprot:XP_005770531.1 hypothetical protein EMIHUDRAFT_196172 [Emiliania huxleyi CCMP1516]